MREIKVRAWNANTKTMGPEVSLTDILEWRKNTAARPIDTSPMIYMEWTGLKDKHGIAIFEGDIWKDYAGDTYVVEFVDGLFTIFDNELSEVIGNIYENPELLNH
jgi:hypothetical protein